MIDLRTIFLMGYAEAQAKKSKDGAPFPNDPQGRQAWLAGHDAYTHKKPIKMSALKKWGRWDV